MRMNVILIVLDSVGNGAAPDAAEYGDAGANTLAHLAEAVGGIHLPILQQLGLGNIPALMPAGSPIRGVPAAEQPLAGYGAMREVSQGKDTTTGHWELAGLEMARGFHLFPKGPPSFPSELVTAFEARTGRRLIGNQAASGIAIIQELGERQMREGAWIVYTSADSVFQIAAHEEIIPLSELYRACEIARFLCDPYQVGRVIARPFVGRPGAFQRTENRRDYSYPLPEPTVLDRLKAAGVPVTGVGKIEDIFAHRGLTRSFHTNTTSASQQQVMELARDGTDGLTFANLIDFDMLYGHRRDAKGYAAALEQTDRFFNDLLAVLRSDDWLIVTADHGNDPTFHGTDHTREYVPLLVYQPGRPGHSLGIRHGFYDVAQSMATIFGLLPMPRGVSFVGNLMKQTPNIQHRTPNAE
ncbi:MAG: phosphopentomutase [Verrucomicrobia bacterium]|nr:phosphopentomutase [Verrucomicrobiota bacterium]